MKRYLWFLLSLTLLRSLMADAAPSPPDLERLIIKPHAGAQTHAFTRSEFELLFGGVAGPGKTWYLVVDALGLQFTRTPLGHAAIAEPTYRAVLFRRTTTEFTKLIDESKKYYEFFGGTFIWGRRGDPGPSWTFPSGARIFVCHLQKEDTKESHQGQEYQFVGFDELTQFTLTQYLYLFSRCRSTVSNLFPRVRSTTNPTGTGLWWVRARFIKNQKPYVTKHFLAAEDPNENPQGVMVAPHTKDAISRVFIPGILAENTTLAKNDPEYASRIKQLGKVYERALLQGDWFAFGGEFFSIYDPARMLIAPFRIPMEWRLIGSLDPGWGHPCSFALHAMDPERNKYRIATYYFRQKGPQQHASDILKFIKTCSWTNGRSPEMIVAGADAWTHKDRWAIQSSEVTFADCFAAVGLTLQPAKTERHQGWWALKDMMQQKKWYVFDIANQAFIDELTAAPADPRDPDDLKGKGNDPEVFDHALDDERYAVMALHRPSVRKPSGEGSWFDELVKQSGSTKGPWRPGMR